MKHWNNLSLQRRLTLLYAALLGGVLIVFSLSFYLDLRRFLLTSTSVQLRAQAKPLIERTLYSSSGGLLQNGDELKLLAAALSRDLTSREKTAVIFDATGQRLAEGRHLPEEPVPVAPDPVQLNRALAGENEVDYLVAAAGGRHLVLLIPLRRAPAHPEIVGVAQLNAPLTLVDEFLHQQRTVLVAGLCIALLLGSLNALWLTRTSLAPLRWMVATCRRIAAGDLSQRVNLPQRQDEVGQLASAFDEMVEYLELSFAKQRRFIAAAAHELRTPLTALGGTVEILLRGAQDDPATANHLAQGMRREVARLNRLTEQLLEMAKLEFAAELDLKPADIAALFADFAPQARLLAGARTIEIEPGPPATVSYDADALKQVLFNLTDNAVQHTPVDGRITLGWKLNGADIELWVADNGEGIKAEDLPYIFEPFYRGDQARSRRRGGAGLGLAIVKAILEAHGGRVRVRSNLSGGACFVLTLPTTLAPSPARVV
jgi:two-component system OmpR family sensor kinase